MPWIAPEKRKTSETEKSVKAIYLDVKVEKPKIERELEFDPCVNSRSSGCASRADTLEAIAGVSKVAESSKIPNVISPLLP